MTAPTPAPVAFGFVLLATSAPFDPLVAEIVAAANEQAGANLEAQGSVFRGTTTAGTATLTPEPAPMQGLEPLAPIISEHANPPEIVARMQAHTGVFSIQIVGTDPAAAQRQLTAMLAALAAHPAASVVVDAGARRVWTAPEFVAAAAAPTRVAPSAAPSTEGIGTVILLTSNPPGLGTFIETLSPGGKTIPAEVPLPKLRMTINGQDVELTLVGARFAEPMLGLAVSESPVPAIVRPAVEQHIAHLAIRVLGASDPFAAQNTLSTVTAMLLDRLDGVAVFLPHQESLTTDVLYMGETSQRPALTWFRTHAMVLDAAAGTAHSFTRGLAAFGGTELQFSGAALSPADAFKGLRAMVADHLERGTVPQAGAVVTVAGAPYTLTPGADLMDQRPVLNLVPAAPGTPAANAHAAPQKKKFRLFGR